jgi:hypothetical protein
VSKWIDECRHPNAVEIEAARVAAPRGVWLGGAVGADTALPYPCRCGERRGRVCSAAFCPCAGRSDPQGPACCGHRFRPEDHLTALREWQAARERKARGEE